MTKTEAEYYAAEFATHWPRRPRAVHQDVTGEWGIELARSGPATPFFIRDAAVAAHWWDDPETRRYASGFPESEAHLG